MAYNPPIGSIYHLYTTYILPSGGLYATYHLLQEPETTIEFLFVSMEVTHVDPSQPKLCQALTFPSPGNQNITPIPGAITPIPGAITPNPGAITPNPGAITPNPGAGNILHMYTAHPPFLCDVFVHFLFVTVKGWEHIPYHPCMVYYILYMWLISMVNVGEYTV